MAIIDYKDYKKISGEMDEEEFNKVKKASWTQQQFKKARKELMAHIKDIGLKGIPSMADIDAYTKISFVFPQNDPSWKFIEMYLVQGKK